MTREEVKVEFAGLTHDHLLINKQDVSRQTVKINEICTTNNSSTQENQQQSIQSALSTIAILRRHPMYDSLVLKKRYSSCLNGYTLEFPTTDMKPINNSSKQHHQQQSKDRECCKTKLVSVYLDGDDPIYQCKEKKGCNGLLPPEEEVVYVPMNGLLDRLDNFDRHGVSIDSRVYAFAMGLKTAEKFLTTSSMKEIQETPPL